MASIFCLEKPSSIYTFSFYFLFGAWLLAPPLGALSRCLPLSPPRPPPPPAPPYRRPAAPPCCRQPAPRGTRGTTAGPRCFPCPHLPRSPPPAPLACGAPCGGPWESKLSAVDRCPSLASFSHLAIAPHALSLFSTLVAESAGMAGYDR